MTAKVQSHELESYKALGALDSFQPLDPSNPNQSADLSKIHVNGQLVVNAQRTKTDTENLT